MYGINLRGDSAFISTSVEKTEKAALSVIGSTYMVGNSEKMDSKAYIKDGLISEITNSIYRFTSDYIYLGRGSTDTSAIPWKGKIYSVRIYNRELSQKELDYNYMIDKIRFNIQ